MITFINHDNQREGSLILLGVVAVLGGHGPMLHIGKKGPAKIAKYHMEDIEFGQNPGVRPRAPQPLKPPVTGRLTYPCLLMEFETLMVTFQESKTSGLQ